MMTQHIGKHIGLWMLSPLVALAIVAQAAANDSKAITVVKAGLLYDGTGAEPLENAIVIIEGNKIISVGKANEVKPPEDAEIVDLSHDTVLPGLFDTHGHLRYRYAGGGAAGRQAQISAPLGRIALLMAKNARTQLLTGITTMRMVSEVGFLDFEIKEAIDSGVLPGPRIIPSGRNFWGQSKNSSSL
jgi:imidazolonepropionase-like amidohydrolase